MARMARGSYVNRWRINGYLMNDNVKKHDTYAASLHVVKRVGEFLTSLFYDVLIAGGIVIMSSLSVGAVIQLLTWLA